MDTDTGNHGNFSTTTQIHLHAASFCMQTAEKLKARGQVGGMQRGGGVLLTALDQSERKGYLSRAMQDGGGGPCCRAVGAEPIGAQSDGAESDGQRRGVKQKWGGPEGQEGPF